METVKEKTEAKLIELLKDCGDPYPKATAAYLIANGVTLLNSISVFSEYILTKFQAEVVEDKEYLEHHINETLANQLGRELMKYATLEKKEIPMYVCEEGVRYRARIDVVVDKEDAVWKQ